MRHRRVAFSCVALVVLGIAVVLGSPKRWNAIGSTAAASARPLVASSSSSHPLFNGARIDDFLLDQSAPGAITEVPDPTGSGQTVFKMTVADGDVYPITPTDNPRAELLSPRKVHPGHQYWWSAKFLLPGDFPSSVPGWVTVLEGPYGAPADGTPPWHIEINRNHIQWSRNRSYDWDVPWRMPLVRDRWVRVLVHFRFARHGFVAMWVDGHRVTFFGRKTYNPGREPSTRRLRMMTMDSSNDGGVNSIAILSYRKAGMFPSLTIYQGPTKLGPTRASVAE